MTTDPKQRIIATLDWMIKHFDYMNQDCDLPIEDTPEMKEAKNLLAELKQ